MEAKEYVALLEGNCKYCGGKRKIKITQSQIDEARIPRAKYCTNCGKEITYDFQKNLQG